MRDGESSSARRCSRKALHVVELDAMPAASCRSAVRLSRRSQARVRALVLGTRDYVEKNGFTGVVLGLSGGVDSALAHIAVDALGADRVPPS